MSNTYLCLRQGYQCTCAQCQIWINRWNKELDAFATVDDLMRQGKSLFHIYEHLRAEYPEILRYHHQTIEASYISYINECAPPAKRRKKTRVKVKAIPPTPPPPSPSPSPFPSPIDDQLEADI